jgi:hypothetical protein
LLKPEIGSRIGITEWFPALRGAKSVDPSRTTLATDQKIRRFGRDDNGV